MSTTPPDMPDETPVLLRQIEKLKKINASLMSRVERIGDDAKNPFTLFEKAATLDSQIRQQTHELRDALRVLERSNEALQQAKDIAEAANALKTSFLASISHDLLQPLHAARLGLAVLGDKMHTAEGPGLLHQADRSLNTLETILTTLLDISKFEAGVLKPQMRTVAIADIIGELFAEFETSATQRKLYLRRRGAPAHVVSDPLLLRRILQNLLSNALRYTATGGVQIRCRVIGSTLRLDVTDTGSGIASHRHAAIFEEFQRDAIDAHGEPGSGLGLAIVRRLAMAMEHDLKLWSRPGLGSVFSIFLPLAQEEAERAEPGAPLPFEDVQVLVLAAADPEVWQTIALLAEWGCAIARAKTMQEAERHLHGADRTPDLLIVAGDGGLQTTADSIAHLQAIASAKIPAFMIGAHVEADAGFEILSSPIRPAELRALMSFLLAK